MADSGVATTVSIHFLRAVSAALSLITVLKQYQKPTQPYPAQYLLNNVFCWPHSWSGFPLLITASNSYFCFPALYQAAVSNQSLDNWDRKEQTLVPSLPSPAAQCDFLADNVAHVQAALLTRCQEWQSRTCLRRIGGTLCTRCHVKMFLTERAGAAGMKWCLKKLESRASHPSPAPWRSSNRSRGSWELHLLWL